MEGLRIRWTPLAVTRSAGMVPLGPEFETQEEAEHWLYFDWKGDGPADMTSAEVWPLC